MYKKQLYTLSLLSLCSFSAFGYSDDILSAQQVRHLADTTVTNFFAKEPDMFSYWLGYDSVGQHNPVGIDVHDTKSVVAEFALEHCFRNYYNNYDRSCSESKIAEHLKNLVVHRVKEITRNKVQGVALDSTTRTKLVARLSHNVKQEARVEKYGFEKLVAPYLHLAHKDLLDQKIEVMLQQDYEFQRMLKTPKNQDLPRYEQVSQNREQYAPSAAGLPSYQEVVQDTIVFHKCGHTTDRSYVVAAFESAQRSGKLVACPVCNKQYYHDDITSYLRK